MKQYDYEKILNHVLVEKGSAILILDMDLNIQYFSDLAKKWAKKKAKIINIRDYFDEFDRHEYTKVIETGVTLEKRIKKINKHYFLSSLSPICENESIVGLMETFESKQENGALSYEIKNTHKRAYENSEIENQVGSNNGTVYTLNSIITKDKSMSALVEKAGKIADSNSPVLIYGETGTGKELFAQGIHNASVTRKNSMFIAQNCAAIPDTLLESLLFGTTEGSFTGAKDKPGLFELAESGTIYLDEINSMNLNLQAKLLRVLQENTYMPIGGKKVKTANVRVIASFNEDPISVIKKGKFRRDLYYRLNVIYIRIPHLRDRNDDICELANYFIGIYNKKFQKSIRGIEKSAMEVLKKSKWEGNVRELKNSIERVMNFVDGDYIEMEDISDFIIKEAMEQSDSSHDAENTWVNHAVKENIPWGEIYSDTKPFRQRLEELETSIIRKELNEVGGNIALAARNLGLPRQTLKNKMIKYNIKPLF